MIYVHSRIIKKLEKAIPLTRILNNTNLGPIWLEDNDSEQQHK